MNRRRLRILAAACLVACSGGSTNPPPGTAEIAVHVDGVIVDERDLPVVLLRENDGPRLLPIWIGSAEATSIALEIHQQRLPRPNSHDFAKRLIESVDGQVERVVVTDLRGNTYYATLSLRVGERLVEIDVRPSDAIAVALRMQAPIFVRESLFDATEGLPPLDDSGQPVRYMPAPPAQSIGARPATSA